MVAFFVTSSKHVMHICCYFPANPAGIELGTKLIPIIQLLILLFPLVAYALQSCPLQWLPTI